MTQAPRLQTRCCEKMSEKNPAHEQAQRTILGSLILQPPSYHSLRINRSEFTLTDCRRVLEAIEGLWEEGITPSILEIADWTEANSGRAMDIGEIEYLTQFSSLSWEIPRAVEIVHAAAIDRQVRLIAEGLKASSKRGNKLLAEAMTAFNQIGDHGQHGAILLNDAVGRFMKDAEAREKGTDQGTLIQTGIPDIDKHHLLERGGVLTIAGQTSMGKTAFTIWLMGLWAQMGERILYISTETQIPMATRRFIANASGLNSRKFGYGNDSYETWKSLSDAGNKLSSYSIWIDDESDNVGDIVKSIRKNRQQNGITIVVLDYLQECIENEDPRNEINRLIHATRSACREEPKIALVQLSQLTRGVERRESRKPQLSDLKESGSVEQASDGVLFVWRPYYYREQVAKYKKANPGIMWINMAKTKDGPTGWFGLSWDNTRGQIRGVLEGHASAEPE